jgi:hypothetical protein
MATRKKRRRKQKLIKIVTSRKLSKPSKKRIQRGGGFFDFIPSPILDFTRPIITSFHNFKNQLYGLPLETAPLAFVQPHAQL